MQVTVVPRLVVPKEDTVEVPRVARLPVDTAAPLLAVTLTEADNNLVVTLTVASKRRAARVALRKEDTVDSLRKAVMVVLLKAVLPKEVTVDRKVVPRELLPAAMVDLPAVLRKEVMADSLARVDLPKAVMVVLRKEVLPRAAMVARLAALRKATAATLVVHRKLRPAAMVAANRAMVMTHPSFP